MIIVALSDVNSISYVKALCFFFFFCRELYKYQMLLLSEHFTKCLSITKCLNIITVQQLKNNLEGMY